MAEQALFGRYWEADSVIHSLDPRTKLVGVIFMMVVAFSAGNFPAIILVAVATIAFCLIGNVPISQALRSIAPLSFIIVLTALFNLFWVQGGAVYMQ